MGRYKCRKCAVWVDCPRFGNGEQTCPECGDTVDPTTVALFWDFDPPIPYPSAEMEADID